MSQPEPLLPEPTPTGEFQLDLVVRTDAIGDRPLFPSFTLTAKGIEIRDDLTYDQYTDGLKAFKRLKDGLKLGFARYVEWGRLKFGAEQVHASLQQMEFDMADVKQAIEISTVPPEIRQPNLQAEHYVVLARAEIPAKQKEKWAKVASEQNLTANQLKHSIEAGEVVAAGTANKHTHGILTIHGIRQEFDIWFNRMGGLKGIGKLDTDVLEEIDRELQLPFQVGLAVHKLIQSKKHKPDKKKK